MNNTISVSVAKADYAHLNKSVMRENITQKDRERKPEQNTSPIIVRDSVSSNLLNNCAYEMPNLEYIDTNMPKEKIIDIFEKINFDDKDYASFQCLNILANKLCQSILNEDTLVDFGNIKHDAATNDATAKKNNEEVYSITTNNKKPSNGQLNIPYLAVTMLSLAEAISKCNFMLAGQENENADTISGILKSGAQAAQEYTKRLDEERKKQQKQLDKMKHHSGLGGLISGLAEVVIGCYSGIKSGNFVAAGLITTDGMMRLTAGALIELDAELHLFGGQMMNSEYLQDMSSSGMLFFLGSDAAQAQMVMMTALMIAGGTAELTSLAQVCCASVATTAEVSLTTLTCLTITSLSSTIGMVFAVKGMVESFMGKKSGNQLDPEQVTAAFGASIGLLSLIIDKSGLRDSLINMFSSQLGEDSGKIIDQIIETSLYTSLALAGYYGSSRLSQSVSYKVKQAEAISMSRQYAGKLPQSVLAAADNLITWLTKVNESQFSLSNEQIMGGVAGFGVNITTNSINSSFNSMMMSFINKKLQDSMMEQKEIGQLVDIYNRYLDSLTEALSQLNKTLGDGISQCLSIQHDLFDSIQAMGG